MPNRILREGILTSNRINRLTWEEECFYRRLMSVVDDHGRFEAHPAILRPALYPLALHRMRETSVSRCLQKLEATGLVRLYTYRGKQYLELLDFRQRVRSESKFPGPNGQEELALGAGSPANGHQPEPEHPPPRDVAGRTRARRARDDGHNDGHAAALGGGGGGGVNPPPRGAPPGGRTRSGGMKPPVWEEWLAFAREIGWAEEDARSTFEHYQANGWKVGGRAAMKDWRAAARRCARRGAPAASGGGRLPESTWSIKERMKAIDNEITETVYPGGCATAAALSPEDEERVKALRNTKRRLKERLTEAGE